MSKQQCKFVQHSKWSDDKWTWRCKTCGFISVPAKTRPHRACRNVGHNTLSFLTCPYCGDAIATINARSAGCGCSSSTVEIFTCRYFHQPVLKQAASRCLEKIQGTAPKYSGLTCQECQIPRSHAKGEPELRWVTRQQLLQTIEQLAAQIPPDIVAVAGVPRSGLFVASDIAVRLCLPLFSIGPKGLEPAFGGFRSPRHPATGTLLVVEDSVNTGRALQTALAMVRWNGRIMSAAAYVNPESRHQPDLVGATWPMPHLFEWHFFGSAMVEQWGFDIDGVLFRETKPHGPLFLPRNRRLPLFASGRSERHREGTERWLRAWNIQWDRLVLWDGEENDPRFATGEHKARALSESRCRGFVESSPRQAETIHRLSGKPVICPTNGEVYQ